MKTKEEILIGIFGSCRCAPIYKTSGMTDPECVICNEGFDIINAMQTFADQECAAKDAEIAELKRRIWELEMSIHKALEKLNLIQF